MEGWRRVVTNAGAAGGDGISIAHFASRSGPRIAALVEALHGGRYRPGPLRIAHIPKKKGGLRKLTIPCVSDRVVQSAVAAVLMPLLDTEFEDASFGYRAGRSVKQAVARIEALRRDGFIYTVDADIDRFFDTIPIDALMARFARSVTDSPLTDLIALWLEQAAVNGRGIAQGSPLSPVLANLYLDDLDERFTTREVRIVRYADDFVVLTRNLDKAQAAMKDLKEELVSLGLGVDPSGLRVRTYDETLRFLGHGFVRAWAIASEADERPDVSEALRALAKQDAHEAEAEDTPAVHHDRGLRVLYLNEPSRRLGLRNEGFAVFETDEAQGERELIAIHNTRVDRIEIGPVVTTDLNTLRHALSSDVTVAFTDGNGRTLGQLSPAIADRASRHLAQARHALTPDLRLALSRQIVAGRVANMRGLLRRLNYRHGSEFVSRSAALIGRIHDRALWMPLQQESLMPLEAQAAKIYWKAWASLLLHGFVLERRLRRSGAGAVNIMLDFTSWLLARDMGGVVLSRGLHPGIGILHATQDYRDALVYDLIEAFRAGMVESVVLSAINRKAIAAGMFERLDNGLWRMNRHGQAALIRAYEHQARREVIDPVDSRKRSWRGLMMRQAEAFAAHVEGRGTFSSYVIDH
jgi:CRISPR-associated protein Cas1